MEEWMQRFARDLGEQSMSPREVGKVLHLAREVAHGVERKVAPLAAFLAGIPEGRLDASDAQALLIRMTPDELVPQAGRESWSPDGFIAYSKLCTHAGCPIGLYEQSTGRLFCPCHQSVFEARQGAKPTAGPATRPLPQLPLSVDEEGFLRAGGDFPEPVGPGFWDRP
jgi:ubiquinol-cytochrome c reductase iron-sulfur subunit